MLYNNRIAIESSQSERSGASIFQNPSMEPSIEPKSDSRSGSAVVLSNTIEGCPFFCKLRRQCNRKHKSKLFMVRLGKKSSTALTINEEEKVFEKTSDSQKKQSIRDLLLDHWKVARVSIILFLRLFLML